MTTPPNTPGKWTAELAGAESWRNLDGAPFANWWDAAMALIADECAEWRCEDSQRGIACRDSDSEIIPDSREIRVGIMDEPKAPETLLDWHLVIDSLRECENDDYTEGCGGQDWLWNVTNDQRDDLTNLMQTAVRAWLETHDLMPTWFVIRESWTATAGEARKMAKEKA